MNMEITKSKSDSSADALKNRLARLEKILQQLMQSSGNSTKNIPQLTGSIAEIGDNGQGNLLAGLSLSPLGGERTGNNNQPAIPNIRVGNIAKTGRNSLLLSQGQIIAELASVIAHASRRNS